MASERPEGELDFQRLRCEALRLVREEYDAVAAKKAIGIRAINRLRPEHMKFQSVNDLVRESLARAGAISTFAVSLGLITSDEARQMITDFGAMHPEIREDLDEL